MIKKLIFSFFSFLIFLPSLNAQSFGKGEVTSLMANANAGVAATSPWASLYNPAGLAEADTAIILGLNSVYNPSWQGWNSQNIIAFIPIQNKGIGVSASHFGDMLYQENTISTAIGSRIRQFSLGAGVKYWQVSIQDYGSTGNVYFDFGGQVHINQKLVIGAHIFNITQAKIKGEWASSTPVTMKAGFSYQVSKQIQSYYEFNKSVIGNETHRLGLSYQLSHSAIIRGGVALEPIQYSVGLGIKHKTLGLDLTYLQEKALGSQMAIGLHYRFPQFSPKRKS